MRVVPPVQLPAAACASSRASPAGLVIIGQWAEDIDPWAVVVRHGRWYLLCRSHRAGAVRAYRVDRIQPVTGGREPFRAPGDVNCADLLEQHLGTGWEFETRVVFDAPYEEVAPHVRFRVAGGPELRSAAAAVAGRLAAALGETPAGPA